MTAFLENISGKFLAANSTQLETLVPWTQKNTQGGPNHKFFLKAAKDSKSQVIISVKNLRSHKT